MPGEGPEEGASAISPLEDLVVETGSIEEVAQLETGRSGSYDEVCDP
jgi:hypothetical protein